MIHRRCLRGTGGCTDWPFRLRADGSVQPLRRAYLTELHARVPGEWGLWKGVHLNPETSTLEAPVYLPGDANCCPSFVARARLHVTAEAVHADTLTVVPDTGSGAWNLDRVEGAGHIRPNSWFRSLVRSHGSTVVRVGTPLARLEEIRGGPVVFAGFGWDSGGTLLWRDGAGEPRLMLTPEPGALRALDSNPRSGELYGEGDVSSDHPLVAGLGVSVDMIMIEWAQPAADQIRFCG